MKKNKAWLTVVGFLLAGTGFLAIILSLVGLQFTFLAWLDDMGYASVDPAQSGKKQYRITPDGEAFLEANRAAADELLARAGGGSGHGRPAPIVRAMENLKLALRLRMQQGTADENTISAIAAAIDAAAQEVERS